MYLSRDITSSQRLFAKAVYVILQRERERAPVRVWVRVVRNSVRV